MKILILSPHTDDAIFSLGDYMASRIKLGDQITILSVFAGIPMDSEGRAKHETLRAEHTEACKSLGVKEINLGFLDDVYKPRPKDDQIYQEISHYVDDYDRIFIPLGTHHPDHIQIRDVFIGSDLRIDGYYRELPYATIYPELVKELENRLTHQFQTVTLVGTTDEKRKAVEKYVSQIQSDHILGELYTQEIMYV